MVTVLTLSEAKKLPLECHRVDALSMEDPTYWEVSVQSPKLVTLAGMLIAELSQGQHVYVNCRSGISRSVAVVLVWLLSKNYIDKSQLEDAVRLLDPDTDTTDRRIKNLNTKTRESIIDAASTALVLIFLGV